MVDDVLHFIISKDLMRKAGRRVRNKEGIVQEENDEGRNHEEKRGGTIRLVEVYEGTLRNVRVIEVAPTTILLFRMAKSKLSII